MSKQNLTDLVKTIQTAVTKHTIKDFILLFSK